MDSRRTVTSTLLLNSLADRDNSGAWNEIDARYRPVIIGFARGLGLSEEDAADVAQQALAEFARDYLGGKYQRGKGRLGSWLMGIAHHRAIDTVRARARRKDWRGDSAMIEQADRDRVERTWDQSQKQAILQEALRRLKESSRMAEHTLRAFELVALQNVPAEEAARQCGISVDEVYVAKNRVTKRLREIVSEITGAFEEDA